MTPVTETSEERRLLERQVKEGDLTAAWRLVEILHREGATLQEIAQWLPAPYEDPKGTTFDRGYAGWSPGDDYMKGPRVAPFASWDSDMEFESWRAFYGDFKESNDDYNLVADFYFQVSHDAEKCGSCEQTGYNPETREISQTFYDHQAGGAGLGWNDKLTQDEVEALRTEGRLFNFGIMRTDTITPTPSAAQVNENEKTGMGHDAINRHILIEVRAKRLGVYGKCKDCDGHGEIRTSPDKLALNLWLLHPRKGASRGVEIKSVEVTDLPQVREFLVRSWKNHRRHFSWVTGETP